MAINSTFVPLKYFFAPSTNAGFLSVQYGLPDLTSPVYPFTKKYYFAGGGAVGEELVVLLHLIKINILN